MNVVIHEHTEVVSSTGATQTFFTWENAIGDMCGGFFDRDQAIQSAAEFHTDEISIIPG